VVVTVAAFAGWMFVITIVSAMAASKENAKSLVTFIFICFFPQ
jgi:hypothetical protein